MDLAVINDQTENNFKKILERKFSLGGNNKKDEEKMFKRFHYIIVSAALLMCFSKIKAQIAMPDTVCTGTNRVYKVNDATSLSTYTWRIEGIIQTSTKNDISVTWNTAGTFLLTVQEHSQNGCDGDIRSGLVHVIAPPVPNAGPDAVICFDNTARLNGSGGVFYQWSPPTYLSNAVVANPSIISPPQGRLTYFLKVINTSGCKSIMSDTVVITILPPVKVFAGNDTSIAVNQPLQLYAVDVNNSGFINYLWSPSSGLNNSSIKNPVALFNNTIGNNDITYKLTARTINGCQATGNINIKVFVQTDIYVPNAFTPNKDGLNDVLRPILVGIKELKYFAVYNRYGQQVYITSVQGKGWNGMVNGEMQNTGAFAWTAEAVDYKGNVIKKNGMAVLIK
jgi:gliding motility-associated-like protein